MTRIVRDWLAGYPEAMGLDKDDQEGWIRRSGLDEGYRDPRTPIVLKRRFYRAELARTPLS
jgi:hypothetical protein